MLENKLLGTIGKSFHPYVSGAIGVAYNQFADWRTVLVQKSTIGQNQRTPQFANNTMTSLTYSIGVGFDEDITEHIRLGIGYRFSDLGEVRAGNGTIAMPLPPSPLPVLFKPSQRLQAHEVVAQLTYLF
jgi:opacity protein-like surface antigen